jgi:hypothetical protein
MSTEIIASKIPANNSNPGQNGFQGASSLTPGQGAAKAAQNVAPPVASLPANNQTRPVSAPQAVPTKPGMKNPNSHPAQIQRAISRQGTRK